MSNSKIYWEKFFYCKYSPYLCTIIRNLKRNTMKTSTKKFELTEKETIFLKEFGMSDFYENGIDSIVWDYSVNDNLPFTGKVRSGVISSLEQKGIINVYKKMKGDIAGTYHLSDEAKLDQNIVNIVERIQTEVKTGVRKVGDLHKNGLWVWKQTKSGKFDWRVK